MPKSQDGRLPMDSSDAAPRASLHQPLLETMDSRASLEQTAQFASECFPRL
jgi:hypothetical protein